MSDRPDLDACAAEPIHIPGSIQPHGVLLAVSEPELVVLHASSNLGDIIGVPAESALGSSLEDVLGEEPVRQIRRANASFSDLRERNPLDLEVATPLGPARFDAILHRDHDMLLVELEVADGPRPFSFPNTYLAVRSAVDSLNTASSLGELFTITAHAVRRLTGFDRVMVYRYDHLWNGEVVAEAKREDLNSFLGLHYPASDIPAQARALYEKNWIRLIADVSYTPNVIVPTLTPGTGRPLDLTYSTLRSVSPVHIEYLGNMGVSASMSISLLREGRLWGLIACHHYSGRHLPPYGTRAAAEFLGSTLSLRLVDRFEDEQLHARLAAQQVLGKLTAATLDESDSLPAALLGAPDLLDLVPAEGVAISVQGEYRTRGVVLPQSLTDRVAEWARNAGSDVTASDCVADDLPDLDVDPVVTSGVLVVTLPDDGYIVWFREEHVRSVEWGGDPHNKALAEAEDGTVRLSPRKSFEAWRETVRGRSRPWVTHEVDVVTQLRRHAIDALYQRAQTDLRLAEKLQRSLLPTMPVLPAGWDVSAHYEPAARGQIGGDWYDALFVPAGRLAIVLGDVAGHGIAAAGTMAQVRNVLRTYLHGRLDPAEALARLNDFVCDVLPGVFATVTVSTVDLATGELRSANAGHPLPFLLTPDGRQATPPIPISPPIGVLGVTYTQGGWTLERGARLITFTDGLIERRTEDLEASRDRFGESVATQALHEAHGIWSATATPGTTDDATVLVLHRQD